MYNDDKLEERWAKLIESAGEESDPGYTVKDNNRRSAIVRATIKKYDIGDDPESMIDIHRDAVVHNTVDGDYWVDCMVFISHSEVFKSSLGNVPHERDQFGNRRDE